MMSPGFLNIVCLAWAHKINSQDWRLSVSKHVCSLTALHRRTPGGPSENPGGLKKKQMSNSHSPLGLGEISLGVYEGLHANAPKKLMSINIREHGRRRRIKRRKAERRRKGLKKEGKRGKTEEGYRNGVVLSCECTVRMHLLNDIDINMHN